MKTVSLTTNTFILAENKMKNYNNLHKIFTAMAAGKYVGIIDPKGKAHCGLVNSVMREDGSGKNWIVTITNNTVNEKVFIYAY